SFFCTQMAGFVRKSNDIERTPVLEMILSAGEKPLISDKTVFNNLVYQHLGLNEGSVEYSMLKAYLDVIPEHERSVTSAYLLLSSRSGQGEGGLKALLEIFGTVGIKFGQLASIWKVFDPKHQEQLEELLDRAAPMSLAEIEKEVAKNLKTTDVSEHMK